MKRYWMLALGAGLIAGCGTTSREKNEVSVTAEESKKLPVATTGSPSSTEHVYAFKDELNLGEYGAAGSSLPANSSPPSEHGIAPTFNDTPFPTVTITDRVARPAGELAFRNQDFTPTSSAGQPALARRENLFARRSAQVGASTQPPAPGQTFAYDPSNGTVSDGDVWRVKNGAPDAQPIWANSGTMEKYPGDRYTTLDEKPFKLATIDPMSTFSIDVDTASYSNIRSMINAGQVPNPDAVRIEEMINYFPYSYPEPINGDPFSASVEVAGCPWELEHRLVRIGLHGKNVDISARPASNMVFLLDVSGSMSGQDRLPLVKQSLAEMTETLNANDRVSIVVYAGAAGLVLPPTSGADKTAILGALDRLGAGGSTAGGAGIQLAYDVAQANFVEGGINRVILATDGDFNVGTTSTEGMVSLVQERAKSGVFLTVLGVGRGNMNDAMMEEITNKGNGNYAYLDSIKEGRKVLVEQMSGTTMTIAKDVKIQVEFNPARVQAYRLVGYENRMLAHADFADDTKDAGEIGAGHTVTALYEVVPHGIELELPTGGEEVAERPDAPTFAAEDLLLVNLRYKQPDGDTSTLISTRGRDTGLSLNAASDDFIFAASVASFGMALSESRYRGLLNLDHLAELAEGSASADPNGHRKEFAGLVRQAKALIAGAGQ